MNLQSVSHGIYPPQCVACDAQTAEDHGLCSPCWGDTRFVTVLACGQCAAPLLGWETDDGLLYSSMTVSGEKLFWR